MKYRRTGHGSESVKLWRSTPLGRCDAHGLIIYVSRTEAKRAINSMRSKGAMTTFPCDATIGFHVGFRNKGDDR